MTDLHTAAFKTAWAQELAQEFVDAAAQGGADMVKVYGVAMGPKGLEFFLNIIEDQEISEDDLILSYDPETEIFELDFDQIDFEVI